MFVILVSSSSACATSAFVFPELVGGVNDDGNEEVQVFLRFIWEDIGE